MEVSALKLCLSAFALPSANTELGAHMLDVIIEKGLFRRFDRPVL